MWFWIVVVVLFLYLTGRFLQENSNSGAPRGAVIVGTLCDALGLVALSLGVFGLLMAAFLGIWHQSGPHLAGDSLRGVLLWSAGLILFGILLMIASVGMRRRGRRVVVVAPTMRGQ